MSFLTQTTSLTCWSQLLQMSALTKAFLKSLGSIPESTSCNNGRAWLRPVGYDSSGLTSALATDVTQFKVAVNWWGSVRVPKATYNLWQESTHSDVIGLYRRIFFYLLEQLQQLQLNLHYSYKKKQSTEYVHVSTHYNLHITCNQLTVCYLQKKRGLYRRMLKIEFTWLNF